jgi:hypothetical protein
MPVDIILQNARHVQAWPGAVLMGTSKRTAVDPAALESCKFVNNDGHLM